MCPGNPPKSVALVLAVSLAAAQVGSGVAEPASKTNFGIYALEAGGATVGGVAGLGVGLMYYIAAISHGVDEPEAFPRAMAIGLPCAAVGLAGGASGVGAAFSQRGRFWPTLAWSAGSMAIGLAVVAGGAYVGNNDVGPIGQLAPVVVGIGLIVPSVFTTVGYNRSRPRDSYGGRFMTGSVGLASVRDAMGLAHPSVDVRLFTVGF